MIAELKRTLNTLGVRPHKSRGQNFLVDESELERLVADFQFNDNLPVLEIGPGLGALTNKLIGKTAKLAAIEIEPAFVGYLQKLYPAVTFRTADICSVTTADLKQLLGKRLLVVGNIPYSISTNVINWLIDNRALVSHAHLLLQQGFAERVAASPGTRDYGSLSVWCSLFADCSLGPVIGGECFYPKAAVASQLLTIKFLASPRVPLANIKHFQAVVRACFQQKRKTLVNNLAGSVYFASKADATEALVKLEIDPSRRAETLQLAEFNRLAQSVSPSAGPTLEQAADA